jgi:hypothetical protein
MDCLSTSKENANRHDQCLRSGNDKTLFTRKLASDAGFAVGAPKFFRRRQMG